MGRFIVLFLIVGAVVMFLLVLNTPPQIIRDSYLYQRYVASERSAEEAELEPPAPSRPSPRRAIARTTRPVEVSSAAPERTDSAEPLSTPRIEYAGAAESQAPAGDVVSVGRDALVYSSNSQNAPVLKVINKGQVVEVDLEFITPGGRWALVTIPEEQLSGFVRTDGLVMVSGAPGAPVVPATATLPGGAQ